MLKEKSSREYLTGGLATFLPHVLGRLGVVSRMRLADPAPVSSVMAVELRGPCGILDSGGGAKWAGCLGKYGDVPAQGLDQLYSSPF